MSLRSSKKLGFLTLVLLLAGLGTPLLAAGGDLQVVDYRATGSMVAVTVANNGSVAENALVTVTVEVAEGTVQGAGSAKVMANGTAIVVIGFGEAVNDIIIVGITEDNSPI